MGKVLVLGSSNTDMVVRTQKMPKPGETVLGGEFDMIAGGKGANQAVAAARAGANVTLLTKLGNDDFGKQAIAEYQKDNIDTSSILIDDTHPSGVAIIIVDDQTGENSIVVAPGSNGQISVEDIQSKEALFDEADILLVQLEIPIDAVFEALKIAKQKGLKTILNPAPAQTLSDDLLKLVDIITPNETETALLVGIKPIDERSTRAAANKLLSRINNTAIITLGSKGVYFASNHGEAKYIPTIKVEAVDTTAAGDTFNGYFAAEYVRRGAMEQAICMANKAASTSVTRRGAQPSIPKISEL